LRGEREPVNAHKNNCPARGARLFFCSTVHGPGRCSYCKARSTHRPDVYAALLPPNACYKAAGPYIKVLIYACCTSCTAYSTLRIRGALNRGSSTAPTIENAMMCM
jgi:hypothetical protein